MKLFFWFFFLVACSSVRHESDLTGVPLEDFSPQKERQVVIKEVDYGVGPEPLKTMPVREVVTEKEPVVGLVLGPGLYRTLAYLFILKSFKEQEVNIRLISGSGLSAIIATHFAAGISLEKTEWLFYKFFNQARGDKIFSTRWQQKIDENFLEEFKGRTIQELYTPLIIPVFDRSLMKVKQVKRGLLYPMLKAQFTFGEVPYTSALGKKTLSLRNFGADIVIVLSVLEGELNFLKQDSPLPGLWVKIREKMNQDADLSDLYFKLPLEKNSLDSTQLMTENRKGLKEYGKKVVKLVQKHIQDWKKRHR